MNNLFIPITISLLTGLTSYFIADQLYSPSLEAPSMESDASRTAQGSKPQFTTTKKLVKDDPIIFIQKILEKPYTAKNLVDIADSIKTLDEAEIQKLIKQFNSHRGNDQIITNFLYERWAELNPEAALKNESISNSFNSDHSLNRNLEYKYTVFKSWLLNDPQKALAYYDKGDLNERSILKLVARHKIAEDPASGIQWISDKTKKGRKEYFNVFNDFVLSKPPQEIYQFISGMNLSFEMRDSLLKTTAAQWALQDWNQTKSWLNTLTPDDKGAAYSSALEYYATQKPYAALAEITPDDIKSNSYVLYPILPFLLQGDLNIPAEWMKKNYPADNPRGLENIVRAWCITDAESTMNLLNQFPDSSIKRDAHRNIVKFGEPFNVKDKLNNLVEYTGKEADTHNSPAYQYKYYELLQKYNDETPEGARNWIQQSPFSEDIKKDFTEKISNKNSRYFSDI